MLPISVDPSCPQPKALEPTPAPAPVAEEPAAPEPPVLPAPAPAPPAPLEAPQPGSEEGRPVEGRDSQPREVEEQEKEEEEEEDFMDFVAAISPTASLGFADFADFADFGSAPVSSTRQPPEPLLESQPTTPSGIMQATACGPAKVASQCELTLPAKGGLEEEVVAGRGDETKSTAAADDADGAPWSAGGLLLVGSMPTTQICPAITSSQN